MIFYGEIEETMQPKTILFLMLIISGIGQSDLHADTIFCTHKVILDAENKIIPWYTPKEKAYDHFLKLRWSFIKTQVPNSPGPAPRSNYPQYYFYDGFFFKDGAIVPDNWMNDVGEKIPNWFENARLFYAYSGDSGVMKIVKDLIDYTLEHGTSASNFAWPNFPYTTTNYGDLDFRGLTTGFELHETHLDHAAEMGLTYCRMYLFYRDKKYLTAALNVADVLAGHVRTGTAEKSVWPYRINMQTGKITAEYGANWTGAYLLFDHLVKAGVGKTKDYEVARDKARDFLLQFPLKTGYWTDGHSDNPVNSNTYKSNLSASNFKLALFDYPELDPNWKKSIPELIRWTEDNFIFRCAPKGALLSVRDIVDLKRTPDVPSEPATIWGAHVVGEQDGFIFKMDYQTARYGAECARWYAISGDESYKEKAYRALNLVTYCNDTAGMAFESPFSNGIATWWSDCYGECPRMFYQAFAGIPEWAPPHENHILYSEGILRNVQYNNNQVQYHATANSGIEYIRLAYRPIRVSVNGNEIGCAGELKPGTYTLKDLGNGDYSLVIKRTVSGNVLIEGPDIPVHIDGAVLYQRMDGIGVNANTRSREGDQLKPEPDHWYAGDIHVHRDCGGPVDGILPESKFTEMMEVNDLAVISVLADMGDAEVRDSKTDLPKVNGKDAPQSVPGRTVHYDAEWHWDPFGTTFEHKALGGHIVLLGLTEAHQIWEESSYKILEYGRKQNGIVGFCHTEYLNDQIQHELNCCIPIEYPVEAALGTTDFFSEDVYGNNSPYNGNYNADATINAYYKLLNCGIRLGLAAGTDYPCNGSEPFGTLLTYVQVDAPFTYRKWVEGIKYGKTVVARNGHQEFIDMKVNGQYQPGADIKLKSKEKVHVEVTWTSVQPLTGLLELVCNGKVIARQEGTASPGKPIQLFADYEFLHSGWICARRMDDKGHQTHTAPVYVTVNDAPVRASSEDAQYFIHWIDNLLEKTSTGGPWNQYFTHDLEVVQGRYKKARDYYIKIASEAKAQNP